MVIYIWISTTMVIQARITKYLGELLRAITANKQGVEATGEKGQPAMAHDGGGGVAAAENGK